MSFGAWKQYRLVMWKNWKLFYRNIKAIIVKFVVPIAFITMILYLREESIREYTVDIMNSSSPKPPLPLNTKIKPIWYFFKNVLFERNLEKPHRSTCVLERLPYKPYVRDNFFDVMRTLGNYLLVMAFLNVFLHNVKLIVEERETNVKEMVLIMGLARWIDWIAWLTKIFLENLLISLLAAILFKHDFRFMEPALPFTNGYILFIHLLIYLSTLCTFAVLVSTFFKTSDIVTLVSALLFVMLIVPEILVNPDNLGVVSVCSLFFSSSAFIMSLHNMFILEEFGLGCTWEYLWLAPGKQMYSVGDYWIGMLGMNVVHIVLALYIEQILESRRPWYFPAKWLIDTCRKPVKPEEMVAPPNNNATCELPPTDGVPSVKIVGLTKQYGKYSAVNNLSMVLYEDQVTILLGENGAGKSTAMSMLTGVLEPTSGTAYIYGQDIRTEMATIRNNIGLCPQQNILFPQLTVKEHLLFFGQLKGLDYETAEAEGTSFMDRLGLTADAAQETLTLSGGTKRKVNLAIALVGPAKVLFLDEPTTGVDPSSRRDIWDLLEEVKKNKMILLSTHFMDEADVLGDRVAIIQRGKLKCSGSSYFLKTTFGTAYKLTCGLREGGNAETLLRIIRRFVPDAQLVDHAGMEFEFSLSPKYLGSFGELFKSLESVDRSVGLASYGIEMPNLQDVFLEINKVDNDPDVHVDLWGGVQPLQGFALEFNRAKAVFLKKFFFNYRNRMMFLVQLFLPAIVVGLMVSASRIVEGIKDYSELIDESVVPRGTGILEINQEAMAPSLEREIRDITEENVKYFICQNRKLNRRIFKLIIGVSIGLIFQSNMIGTMYVLERASGALNLQFIGGLSPILYWLYSFIYDLFVYILSIVVVLVIYLISYDYTVVGITDLLGILFLYAFAVHPLIYLRAMRYKSQNGLFIHIMIVGTLMFVLYLVVMALRPRGVLRMIMNVLPFFNLCDSLYKWHRNKLGSIYYVTRENLGYNYLYFGVLGIICFVLLILHDLKQMNWLYDWKAPPKRPPLGELSEEVQTEMDKVDGLTKEDINSKLLVAKHLMKSYKKKVAVKDVTFVLDRGECLGLLGKNAAGKTTLFKMLIGEESITEGEVWIRGVSIKRRLMNTYDYFGYCPQVNAMLEDLTGLETMTVMGLIRGVPLNIIRPMCKSLAMDLGFEKYIWEKTPEMSGGTKRRLSTALALIGNPDIVFMDEPTTGMDPVAKRLVWNVMDRYRASGHSVILSSHSMEECDYLCTRLAILMDGKLEALASGYSLKKKYSKTGHLLIQLVGTGRGRAEKLKKLLDLKLKELVLKEEYQGKLVFTFSADEKLSKVFDLMEDLKEEHKVESYAVTNQNSLVSVFLDFVTK